MFRTLAKNVRLGVYNKIGDFLESRSFNEGEPLYVFETDKGLMLICGIDKYVYFREDDFLPKLDASAQKANEIFKYFTKENKINIDFEKYNYKEFKKFYNYNRINKK